MRENIDNTMHMEIAMGLSQDYVIVYLVDYNSGSFVNFRMSDERKAIFEEYLRGNDFEKALRAYVKAVVYEPDKETVLCMTNYACVREKLLSQPFYSVNYRIYREGELQYFQIRIARIGESGAADRVVVGFRRVDEDTGNDLARKNEIEEAYEIISGLSSDYNFISLFNPDGGKMSIYKADSSMEIKTTLARHENYQDAVDAYTEYVSEEDKERWRETTLLENIRKELSDKQCYDINIRNNVNGEKNYIQFRFAKVKDKQFGSRVVIAKRIITDIVENEMKQQRILEDALARAEHASRAKSTFLSNMSHDIRTPMNAIIGFTSLASTHLDNKDRVRDYLEKIMSSSNHLLSLINDVLEMSRIESGKLHLNETECNLSEIMHELRNILQVDVREKKLDFFIDTVDVFDENVICDRLRLNQILLNLLGNSIKFTKPGGSISVRILEKEGGTKDRTLYEIRVKDNGIGMSEEFVKRIFEPFEREKNTTVSGIQGTGLGMPITKNIVEAMGGTIEVYSKQNEGSEFIVTVPFKLSENTDRNIVIEELKGVHALVVDDDFNTCDSVTQMLMEIGLRAEWTLNGKEALLRTRQAIRRHDEYKIYIIDWLMPDMSGVEVAKSIRSEIGDSVPIIVLTAYDWADIEEEAREAGVNAFCSKPLFISEFIRCLVQVLNLEKEEKEKAQSDEEVCMGGRILLVEDNELNREIATEILTEAGFQIEEADNGKTAVEMLKASKPGYYKLVLMDIQMPVMDGYEATRAIRQLDDDEISNIPIVAMTANAFDEDRKKAFECGMNSHIAKPVDVEILFDTLKKIL
ncbi:MAG: response regulator [Dorea sp.]|nr:response regulator [Dorea sp.]